MAALTWEAGNVNSRISSTSWGLISQDPDKSSKTGSLHTRLLELGHYDQRRQIQRVGGWGGERSLSPYTALRFSSSFFSKLWSPWHCFRHFQGFKVLEAWYGPSMLDPKTWLFWENSDSLNTSLSYLFGYFSIENEPKPSRRHSELLPLSTTETRTPETSLFSSRAKNTFSHKAIMFLGTCILLWFHSFCYVTLDQSQLRSFQIWIILHTSTDEVFRASPLYSDLMLTCSLRIYCLCWSCLHFMPLRKAEPVYLAGCSHLTESVLVFQQGQ